jgi:uncharacterized lipoprotein YddW (UPF0748 family)
MAQNWRFLPWIALVIWAAGSGCATRAAAADPAAAGRREIVLVVPDQPPGEEDQGEWETARETATLVAKMLAELGLPCDTLSDSALSRDGLRGRPLAVLAYHPQLPDAADAALARFVQSGGKVLACYLVPPRLAAALGFSAARYVRQQRPGQFAEIRFTAADVAGLPPSVRQDSWNLMVPRAAAFHARVIGRWYDDAGQPTGQAALLLSDRGAVLTHIVLPEDREGKKQMLAAVVGYLSPPLWRRMAAAMLDRAGRAGQCESFAATAAVVKAGRDAAAAALLAAAGETLAAARRDFAQGRFAAAAAAAGRGHQQLVEAYLRGQPSRRREARAVWNHSGTGAYPGDWERSARELARNGLNMIFPNMLWGGLAHYPSDVLPRSEIFRKYGDQIAQCLAAARRHGLEVHVWKVHFNLSGAPPEFVARMRRERRTQVSRQGRPVDWLCPSHPENRRLEVASMVEVARRYAVDGLQLDYIRYPDGQCCYCDGCRQRFEADSGRPVRQWPADCATGPRKDEYNDWRVRQITLLVADIHREVKRVRPGLKLSAAVWGGYPDCRQWVAQDWPAWIRAGYLDFVCPMDYTDDPREFADWVRQQMKLVGGRIPVYAGIGATASSSALSADGVAGQVDIARGLGAGGFSIFNFEHGTAVSIIPGIGLGVGRTAAVPPHRGQ